MPAFTTRVELHRATADDYETLHDAMDKRGFSRLIESEEGISYHLPTAEYDISCDLSRSDVLELAKAAAAKTNKAAAILVTESRGRTWSGLAKAS
jgi:hypothetical protein